MTMILLKRPFQQRPQLVERDDYEVLQSLVSCLMLLPNSRKSRREEQANEMGPSV
jgi:hypothetical protein